MLYNTSVFVLYCTVLYCDAMYYTVLQCTPDAYYCTTVLYCTGRYIVLYCTGLYCAVLYYNTDVLCGISCTAQHFSHAAPRKHVPLGCPLGAKVTFSGSEPTRRILGAQRRSKSQVPSSRLVHRSLGRRRLAGLVPLEVPNTIIAIGPPVLGSKPTRRPCATQSPKCHHRAWSTAPWLEADAPTLYHSKSQVPTSCLVHHFRHTPPG